MRKKISILIFGMLLLSTILVLANGGHESEIEEGRKLVESNISCDELSNEQLEQIGDYYMEEMHPGEAHELMHDMMGGHDSELTKEMHINMAKRIYCGEDVDMMGGGMMSGGMMNMVNSGGMGMIGNNMMGSGMMGNYQTDYSSSFLDILWIVFLIGVIVLIIWLIYKFAKKEKESETLINILQKRYAKGEINKKQFDVMKKELRKG